MLAGLVCGVCGCIDLHVSYLFIVSIFKYSCIVI